MRDDTALAVEDFASESLDFKPADGMMSFGEIARHILDASHALIGLLLDGETNWATPEIQQKMRARSSGLPADADAKALAAELRSDLHTWITEMESRPSAFADTEVTRFDGQKFTMTEILQFVKEHELSHRSQLFVYLRLKGIVPATTRRRLAKSKQ